MFLLQIRSNLFGPCLPHDVLPLFDTFCSPRVADFIPIFQCTRSHVHFTSFTHQWRNRGYTCCLYTSVELHPEFITDVVVSFPYTQFGYPSTRLSETRWCFAIWYLLLNARGEWGPVSRSIWRGLKGYNETVPDASERHKGQ